MRTQRIDQMIVDQLDSWLGIRRRATWKTLDPLQFSIDSGIDEDLALYLFVLCAKINLLKIQYVISCPFCENNLQVYNFSTDIPKEITCEECNLKQIIDEENIIVYFELLIPPEPFHYPSEIVDKMREVGFAGKKRVAFDCLR